LILHRKVVSLRIRHAAAPQSPFWAKSMIAPYSGRRAAPVAIDYLDATASATERSEVTVCENVRDELERATLRQKLGEPVLIEAAERTEVTFRRGEEALEFCMEEKYEAIYLTSTHGALPSPREAVVVIAAWPLDFMQLEALFTEAHGRRWGVVVPVVYPATTDLPSLERLATMAHDHGAQFLGSLGVELDPSAKHAIAETDELYATLFHADLEPLHISTERHIAALAAERKMADFIVPPRWSARSNWNAAILLTLTATRMMAMGHETELAGAMARSARAVAALDKPIERIAESASLGIIEALDEVSVDVLSEWLESGRATYVERINAMWRLRRDYGVA
jgi:hypothetical protein